MNLQQLEYILAVDQLKHFGKAAERCHVTQPTLSMMIKKLEDELEVNIFDRSRQPVEPTEIGRKVIDQAQIILRETSQLKDLILQEKSRTTGPLHLGIIPTLAPYLLPAFLPEFIKDHPDIQLKIAELTTEQLVQQLKARQLDVGILVTPLQDETIREIPLFYEPFLAYTAQPSDKTYILPEDIDPNELWLLEEGHCFRSQIVNLCELRHQQKILMEYQAGSIETLKRLVEQGHGITILPELATLDMTPQQMHHVKPFAPPQPVREVSLIVRKNFVRSGVIELLHTSVLSILPKQIQLTNPGLRIDIY
ncbi:MAG: LysR substrate-binding domain-containing protein [Saprospiraceae bacterium]